MSDDAIKRILTEMQQLGGPPRPAKANRTFRLVEPQAARFIAYCHWKGWNPGEVLDKFIVQFMEVAAAAGDLPSDEVLDQHRVKKKNPAA